jgi:hypothetical protein
MATAQVWRPVTCGGLPYKSHLRWWQLIKSDAKVRVNNNSTATSNKLGFHRHNALVGCHLGLVETTSALLGGPECVRIVSQLASSHLGGATTEDLHHNQQCI